MPRARPASRAPDAGLGRAQPPGVWPSGRTTAGHAGAEEHRCQVEFGLAEGLNPVSLGMEAGAATITVSSTSRTRWCGHRYQVCLPSSTVPGDDGGGGRFARSRRRVASAPPDGCLLSINVILVNALGLFDEMKRRKESMVWLPSCSGG
jgi:hypothetical protein